MTEPEHEQGLSRRGFVGGAVAVLGGMIALALGLPALAYWLAPALRNNPTEAWVPLGPVEGLPPGEPTLFTFTRLRQVGWERAAAAYGIFVIPLPDGRYDVLSNVCTHLSCRVAWKAEAGHYICPCHDGHFARDGAIISGPQPRPLDRYEHRIEDGILVVHVVEA
jgi:menaquinol-cytochrome c reductase iron-sulfur subunit